jgi:hypothetical protein
MKTELALLIAALALGCGGKSHPADEGQTHAPESQPDLCGGYALAIGPPLQRIDRAATKFSAAMSPDPASTAAAAKDLGEAIDREARSIATLKTGRADIDEANATLVDAVRGLAGAVRVLAGVLEKGASATPEERQKAGDGLQAGLAGWQKAVDGVKTVCPEAGQ